MIKINFKRRKVRSNSSSNSKSSGGTKPVGGKPVADRSSFGGKIEITPATPSGTVRNLAPPSPNKTPSPTSSAGAKVKYVMEPEPRKMQAERPLLLQDLSQSKLLLKFKQENKVEPAVPVPASDTPPSTSAAVVDPKPEQQAAPTVVPVQPPPQSGSNKSTPPPEIKTTDSPLPSKTASSSSRKSSFQAKMVLLTKTM